MDKELFLIAYEIALDECLMGEPAYAIYAALEKAYALGVKDHTNDARRTAFTDGYKQGVEVGAFNAYLDVELNGRNPSRADFVVNTAGVAMTPLQQAIYETPPDRELHAAVAALG